MARENTRKNHKKCKRKVWESEVTVKRKGDKVRRTHSNRFYALEAAVRKISPSKFGARKFEELHYKSRPVTQERKAGKNQEAPERIPWEFRK